MIANNDATVPSTPLFMVSGWVVRMPPGEGAEKPSPRPVYYNEWKDEWTIYITAATLYDSQERAEEILFWIVAQSPSLIGGVEVQFTTRPDSGSATGE